MIEDDPLALRILVYLGDLYRPVLSEWVEALAAVSDLGVPQEQVVSCWQKLQSEGLVELSPPDDENDDYAALITAKGLLAIGRAP